jgi:hypothetical protein
MRAHMCRYGAPGGSHLLTFCARVLCAEAERGSAVLAHHSAALLNAGGYSTSPRTPASYRLRRNTCAASGGAQSGNSIVMPSGTAYSNRSASNSPGCLRARSTARSLESKRTRITAWAPWARACSTRRWKRVVPGLLDDVGVLLNLAGFKRADGAREALREAD